MTAANHKGLAVIDYAISGLHWQFGCLPTNSPRYPLEYIINERDIEGRVLRKAKLMTWKPAAEAYAILGAQLDGTHLSAPWAGGSP